MTLTDYTLNKGPVEWIEKDQIVSVQGHIGEDIIIELKLTLSEKYDDLRFELIRDGLPISPDRYQLSMQGNIVQLALKQSRKNDTGYYSLIATRLGQENDKSALKKIHMSISERSYEEGDPPVFLRRLSDLAVKVGTRTRFLVEIRSSSTLKITWYKDDLPIYDEPRFSLVHEGNFHCVDVAPVTVEDQGCWTCMAENHSGRSSCTSTLTVIVPRAYKKPEFVEELRALLTETGTVSLECKVIGVPTPILKWFKDNKEIKAGDVFALTANPDDPTSLGVYTCEAVNCMGTAYSSSKVHVVGRGSREGSLKPADTLTPSGPLPIFKQILQDECCRIGDTVVLSCHIQIPPWPKTITWYNKEGRVEPNEKYHIMEDGIGGYSIEVKQVEAMDEGEWKCVATSENNMKQFTSCYVAMSIPRNYRKPRFMENLKAVLTEEGLVSFECKVVGFPTPLLRWFKDGQELKPGDVYQLTGTNSLGSYCCIAKNCMGEAKSTAELTIEDIQNQLNEEERFQLLSTNQPPKFIKGLRSCEARINEDFRFTVQVSIAPEPTLSWYRDDAFMDESDKYHITRANLGTCHFEMRKLEFVDQAEWKCVAANDFGHSVTSCFLKLIIPKHYKKPKFLENLRAILSEEGTVNLECKVIGVPQPVLKWYKDNVELKPGDIHRIISGQDGTCCLGIYTCEATNCMGTVSSTASLLGFEEKKDAKEIHSSNDHELARNLSLSTIHEERTSQLYDTPQTDHSVTLDERGEVSFSFDGKEVSVSLYETPDLTEEEALQIVEMYADQLSEHVTEHNVIELPPMRFVKETSTTGNLLMEAVVIDVSPDYFVSAEDGDDLRTEADFEDVSIMDDVTRVLSSPERDSRGSLKRSARYNADEDEKVPSRPPRKKSMSISSSKSEKSERVESESFHSAQKDELPLSPLSSLKQDDSDTFADALSSAHLSITESLIQKHMASEHGTIDNRKRSLSAGRSTGSSLDDGIGDSSFDSMISVPKKKQRKRKQQKDKNNPEEYSGSNDYEQRKKSGSKDKIDTKIEHQLIKSVEKTEMDDKSDTKAVKKLFTKEELLGNLKNVKEVNNSHISEKIQESTQDILSESRTALCNCLKFFDKEMINTTPQFSNIYEQINDIYQLLEASRGMDANIETLANLEIPMHALLKEINEITSTEHVKIICNILEPFIIQLSHVLDNLGLLSLEPTHIILQKLSDLISSETKELSSIKSVSDGSRNIFEEIIDPLINIQSIFNGILDYIEQTKLTISKSSSQVWTASDLACLKKLRDCVFHIARAAMTLEENRTLNSLMECQEPLLDLQSILTSEKCTLHKLLIIKEINIAIMKLKNIVITILKNSEDDEVISRVEIILKILNDTDKQLSKLVEQLSEKKTIQKHMLKNLNIDQSLSNVHFALSSILEKQKEHIASYHLITSIEALRQTIGSSAVTIANLKNPINDEITHEIIKLNESLLNLKKDLLIEKYEPQEEQVFNDLMNPISILKEIVYDIIENSSTELIVPVLELLEDIEKDAALVAKEISKKKCQEENITQFERENTEEKSTSESNLTKQIGHSLDSIKNWLSATSEDSTKEYKDEMESVLSSTIEELKRDINQIGTQTIHSELPSDESLIEALIDLREPLVRLKSAISTYHVLKDHSILGNLDHPMKYLLQIIVDVLREHPEEKYLRSIIDIIEQIRNQISLSIKDTLYQQELKENAEVLKVEIEEEEEEEEEEAVTAFQETIPDTFMETSSIEAESTVLLTEQVVTKNNFKNITYDVVQAIKNEKEEQEKEETASKLIMVLSKNLEKLQLEITNMLEDFEESTTQTVTIPQSKLANSIEELRRTISTICAMTVYDKETGLFKEKLNQMVLVLTNLMQPLTNVRNLLFKSDEHDISELIILNRFIPLLNIIENNIIKQIIDFVGKNKEIEKDLKLLLDTVKEIKTEIPIVIQEISLRRKLLEYLWDISKPLESILDHMSDLEKAAEETLETDVANILGKPIAVFLESIKITIQEVNMLNRRQPLIFELRNLVEPLLEFHSCLSVVQSSRRSLVPEASLLDERKNVILRAVDDLQKQVCHTIEVIANNEEIALFNESLTLLNSAILQVQKQIGKTDYSRRSSSTNISLQHRLTNTLKRLNDAIITLEKYADTVTYEIVSKCLKPLQKQISFAQTQFSQISSELIDEEAIVEGFLYPTNQLLSALNILKENVQKKPSAISHNLIVQFQELADSISELSSSLSVHKTRHIQEGTSEKAPIVETFSVVIDVLDHVKNSISDVIQAIEVEQKTSMVITKIESVIDEIIEVSQEEIESLTMITELPLSKTIAQEVVQSKDISTIQTPVLQNLKAIISSEQIKDDLMDMTNCKENQKENERQKHLTTEISKFNSVISNLTQPLNELIRFINSAKEKPAISESEENKRKIQELTALIQILNDLQATNASIKTVITSSSITLLDNEFSNIKNILADFEQAINTVNLLTYEGIKPELKENIMTSLLFISKPLDALKNTLVSICQTINEDKYIDKDGESSSIMKALISSINDTIVSLNKVQISKYVNSTNEKIMEISNIQEKTKDIEKTIAQPSEELIEAITESQEQVKCDNTLPLEFCPPFVNVIESKSIDNLQLVDAELSKTLVKEIDGPMKQDTAETPQQVSLLESSQIEELLIEKTEAINSVPKPSEEVEKHSLAIVDQQKLESTQISENSIIQEETKIETLKTIISSLQTLCKSFDKIKEMEISEFFEETVAFSTLMKPLLNLQFALPSNVTKNIKQTITLLKVTVVNVLNELQNSIDTVRRQVQLNITTGASSNKTSKIFSVQAVMESLEDLRMSIACIQSDPIIIQFIQQKAELLNVGQNDEQILILQNLTQSVVQFGERFLSIINQIKVQTEPSLQVIKQEDQKLNPEILQKIVDPIHILRETLSQIENHNDYRATLLEMSEQKKETVQLVTMIDSLRKLEQSLIMQQIAIAQEEVLKEFSENKNLSVSANLKPVLEELKNSIIVVQSQAMLNEDIPIFKKLNKTLENLKIPLTTVAEIFDNTNEITEAEKISTLLSFANSIKKMANELVVAAKQDVEKQIINESSLLKTIAISIKELQNAILKFENQVSQTLETKKSIKAVTLKCMIQPLQELQQSFSTTSQQETVFALQRLSIKSTLDNLNKSMAIIQDQIMIIQDNSLENLNADDAITLKGFARSFGDLRTSMVVLQQLNAIENAGQQIVEIENASALQAFAKSIEEFQKCCSVIVKQPRVIEAFTTNTESEQLNKINLHLIENIIVPLQILEEQILTIEEILMHESKVLDVTEVKKPITVLSNLVGPLQQLEKSLIATVQKEYIVEPNEHVLITESSSVNLEQLALQPILEEVQKSIATIQEHVILEAGSQITLEEETENALLKTITQPLMDLKTSIASIQQVTAIAPEFLNELVLQQSISALETFAETLQSVTECLATCNRQQIIMESTDTISEDVSLNTWANVIDESSKITRPMVIDQDAIESPIEIAVSISEDETSKLKALAKPLTELRECLALIVEEQKTIPPYDTTYSLSEKEDISFMETMIQPLLELKHAAAIIIQEQMAIECANEHLFDIDDKNECILRPLIEPLEELSHSVAIIQDQMLIETSTDRLKNDDMLNVLAEPLFDLQRAISVLETRVISPDVESIPEDISSSWIMECLATPLHEIEKLIVDIRQHNIMEPGTIIMEKKTRTLIPELSIIEKLAKRIEIIKSAILCMKDNSTGTEVLKIIEVPLTNVQENLTLLRNKYNLDIVEEEDIDAFIESLSNFEKSISLMKEMVDKAVFEQSDIMKIDTAISAILNIPLTELKYSIVNTKTSTNVYLNNLERPLELMQNAFETIISIQRNKKLSELSMKIINNISDINKSIESIENKLKHQQVSAIEIYIECAALEMLTKSLENIKHCIIQIQEKPNTVNSMINTLQSLEKSIEVIQQQSADKPLTEPQHTNFGILSKNLIPCLNELKEAIETTKTLWHEETVLDGLMILEEPICKLQTAITIIYDQSMNIMLSTIDTYKTALEKSFVNKEIKASEIEISVKKNDKGNGKMKTESGETKLVKDTNSAIINDTNDKGDKKKLKEMEQKKENDNKILTELIHKEKTDEVEIKNEKQKKEYQKDEEILKEEHKEQKETNKTEEIKVIENKQETAKKNIEQHKETSTQKRSKMEDKKMEVIKEEPIEKRNNKIEKVIQKTYSCINDIKNDNINENKREYEKINKNQIEIKHKVEEKLNKEFQELKENKNLHLQVQQDQEKPNDERILQKDNRSEFKELKKLEKEEKWEQRKSQTSENWLYTREDYVQKEENIHQERDNNKRLNQMKIDCLEKKRIVRRTEEQDDYVSTVDEERHQKRSEKKRIRRDETIRLLWEEEQRIQKRQEEERFRNRLRRKEQIRDNEWSRKRENESDRFLRNTLEVTSKSNRSTSMFFDKYYSRERTFRFNSDISILSKTSRPYSWNNSLMSLSEQKFDIDWDYKLHSPSMDKYYFDTGSLYKKRRKRDNRMNRARSIRLLKYKDCSRGDSDVTIAPYACIQPFRHTKEVFVSLIDFNTYKPSNYTNLRQSETLFWNKPKKPSFCTRLTNRVVGIGMRIRLTCTVLSNPEPRVYWMKDDQNLDASNNRYRIRYENGMAYLELHDTLPEDAGIYKCVAENTHGISTTESILKVYSDYKPTNLPPTFIKTIKDTYRYFDRKLILECRVQAYPVPIISWLKDGKILQGERYKQSYLGDDVYRLEISDADVTDNGQYTCRVINELHTEETSSFVYIKDVPSPEIKWPRDDRKSPIIPKARIFTEGGFYTSIVPEAIEKDTNMCRTINIYGHVDTSTTSVISSGIVDGGKPAMFVSRPSKKSIDVIVGEDISISFRISGIPKPRIIWMKGLTDITDGPRSYKECIDDYVRLILKRVIPSDEGTYCILIKNRYGCDRSFFSIKVKQRARSLTPLSDWNFVTDRDTEEYVNDMSYIKMNKIKIMPHDHGIINEKNEDMTISRLRQSWIKDCLIIDFLEYLYGHRDVPGPISSEPIVIDGGRGWLSLSWGKAERRGPAPVIAYKVEAWLLGSDGGARWVELGVTPINAFDAFNLRPGSEYKFRVTPRNRYGWGEPVTMTNSVLIIESTDLPEFTKILPGQLKVLEGTPVKLECEVRGDSKMEVRWYHETTEIDPCNDTRFATYYNGSKCSLTITNIKENDSGRYVCEANNNIGKVSSFARILVVTDPRIIEADAKLKTNLSIEPEDRPPQFTMRLRDRRVQITYPVRLTCQVIGHPIPEIAWYKDGMEISQDDRHIFWDNDSNFHTLEIMHSALEDSGCYMVTARNINGSVSCRCTLVVDKGIRAYIAPEFLRGFNTSYTIHSGGELRLSAQLEAYPSVGIVWHRDGIRLRPSRRSIMTLSHDGTVQFSLANVTMRDAGVYSCTATNVVGQTEISTRVTVTTAIQNQSSVDKSSNIMSTCSDTLYSKEPHFVKKPLSTEAIEGDTVIILCEVIGDPKPEVIWLRDFLKPDYYKDAPHFRLVGAGPQYRLEIPYAKLDFTGTYSVIARNCHGETKAVISLQIYAKGQDKEEQTKKSPHGKVLTLPVIKRELRDLRCCDGDAVSLECKVYASPDPPLIRWERGGKIIIMAGDFAAEFDGETARLNIQHIYPEDEGEYTCVAYNDLGKAYTSACLVVDVPEGKENILNQSLLKPMSLLSTGSTPRSTPRSTPIRSLSPAVLHEREFRSQVLPRSDTSKRSKVCPPKFYAVPHNRLVQEGETVRFQCAIVGHPAPWIRWDKNGTIVTPNTRISIKERDDIKILEIIDVMQEDAALYRVIAENDFGRIEASARLEVINRYDSISRSIRTRSASPKTHPSFERSLLPTISRINSHLQLECRINEMLNMTPTWYRNGRPLERSARIKKYFDGTTARLEISKVKASDAGEYTCMATNILGSTRSSCQVTVLNLHDSSIADKEAPQFLQLLPKESIVMEKHCHEFQTGITGTPPFTITWSKDGHELPDNDYYKYIIYEDGGVALRILKVHAQDAGEYTCSVRNNFGVASCSNLFAVQDYVCKSPLQFTKTPLSVIAAKNNTVCFCARVQCEKSLKIIWTINGKDAWENAKCKIERSGNVSILRIRDVSLCDTGEIRCIASVNGKDLSISCTTKLQLQNSLYDFNDFVTKFEDIKFQTRAEPSLTKADLIRISKKMAKLSKLIKPLKCRRHHEKTLTRTKSLSLLCSRYTTSNTSKYISPLIRKRIFNNTSINVQKLQFANDLSIQKVIKENLDNNLTFSKDQRLLFAVNKGDTTDISIKLLSPNRTEQICHQNIISSIPNKKDVKHIEEIVKAAIIKEPVDISVFKGSKAILQVTYQGRPKPTVKWLRVNRELQPSEKIGIVNKNGVSYLTLDNVTYDHAGKYEVSVENPLGKDRRFFSLAVEGPPEPLTDKPSVNLSPHGQITIVWRSPPYDGGRTVLGYTLEAKRVGESTWLVIAKSCYSLSHTVTITEENSVIPGESYCFRIRAENIHGLSDSGMESDPVRIPKPEETMLQEKEDEFKPNFEARLVVPEEGKLFNEKYDVLEELGKGRYGVVKKVIERSTGMNFAAKFVKTIKVRAREQVREEIKIMNTLRHPKLLLLAAAYESPRETVLIMEYISGGELFERVVADDFTLTERDSILFMRQICQGVEYMHQNKIVHLDLKPENIMCRTRTSHQIKLIDFGLAQILKSDTPIRVLFGTPEFIPPEIINYEPIGTKSDMWSVGVICYVLLTGLSPFMGDNDAETFANITRADYDLEDEAFDAISNDAKSFISSLLIKRKELRMSATECLEHPWMIQRATAISRVVLPTEKLKKFIIRRKWQKTGNAIRALGRMAILSAHNRHSPTTTAEASPTLKQQFNNTDIQYSDEIKSICTIVDKDTEDVKINTDKNTAEAELQTNLHSTFVKKVNVTIQETSTKEENSLNDPSKQISTRKEMSSLHTELIPQNVTPHLEILALKENEKDDKEVNDKSSKTERRMISKSYTLCRVFRGDSRDSVIGDCSSSLINSSIQIDDPGVVSSIKDKINQTHNRESKQTLKKENNQRKSTAEILATLVQSKKIFPSNTKVMNNSKVVTKSDVTEASCETNPVRKVIDENTDTRILSRHNCNKFSTGNVSRTARVFERESERSNSSNSQNSMTQHTYPAAVTTRKSNNERIQKAFAFWNK
ncbi:uncharacterized protein LOC105834071 [Monomorium pharaonis]|uniref:uncharacterized protein LOC105834071 n=1 Tax=Monomorium pharaonis TaxID=307658 RepID=UPI0017473208|nr:uncharacterized protein LOC105834071 [Monomorium pharaonis]